MYNIVYVFASFKQVQIPPPPHFNQTLGSFLSYLLSRKILKISTVERKVRALKSLIINVYNLANVDDVVRFLNSGLENLPRNRSISPETLGKPGGSFRSLYLKAMDTWLE